MQNPANEKCIFGEIDPSLYGDKIAGNTDCVYVDRSCPYHSVLFERSLDVIGASVVALGANPDISRKHRNGQELAAIRNAMNAGVRNLLNTLYQRYTNRRFGMNAVVPVIANQGNPDRKAYEDPPATNFTEGNGPTAEPLVITNKDFQNATNAEQTQYEQSAAGIINSVQAAAAAPVAINIIPTLFNRPPGALSQARVALEHTRQGVIFTNVDNNRNAIIIANNLFN